MAPYALPACLFPLVDQHGDLVSKARLQDVLPEGLDLLDASIYLGEGHPPVAEQPEVSEVDPDF